MDDIVDIIRRAGFGVVEGKDEVLRKIKEISIEKIMSNS